MPTEDPIVSTVIPTYGRPQYLPRAIASALTCQGDSVEVVVVPNGPDTSWKKVIKFWRADERVRVLPIETPHGNVARNHGKLNSKGKYIRFLDDDDYLTPEAYQQVKGLEQSGLDISAGGIDLVDERDRIINIRRVPETTDFVNTVLAPQHVSLPHAYLFKRNSIQNVWWDESCNLAQDKLWLYDLCRQKEREINRFDFPVGRWCYHAGDRITNGVNSHEHARQRALLALELAYDLDKAGRFPICRRELVASYLWNQIWCAYHLKPRYWNKMIDKTFDLSDQFNPTARIFKIFPFLIYIHPRLLYPSLIPLQYLRLGLRKINLLRA